jgi:hydroxypyruvate isomerase
MVSMSYELSANVSLLFSEYPFLDRFAAAADAGFRAVEAWWPFADAVPSEARIEELLAAVEASGVRLTGLNLFAGDMAAGMRGVASHPAREAEFRDNVAVIVDIAQRTGCRHFNALYGAELPDVSPVVHAQTALDNLTFAADALAPLGGTILIEPLSGVNGYPIRTADQAVGVVDAVAARTTGGRVGLLYDTFHLSNNGDDLVAVAQTHAAKIGHVQIADAPGRGQPGTGTIDFPGVLDALDAAGYDGFIACEYAPTVPTVASLDWIAALPGVGGPGRRA